MKSRICTTEMGLVLGIMSLEGEDAALAWGGASSDAGKHGRHHYAWKP
jgi:hypothetical protein